MALTLTITSYQSQVLGSDGCRVFDKSGGSIGRAQGNDWVLPDPERYISGQHVALSWQGDAYYLTDTSTNGVFINQSTSPVGKGNSVPLHEGDHLKFGDYEIVVSISEDTGEADPFGAWHGQDVAADNDPFSGGAANTGGLPESPGFPDSELPTDGGFDIFSDKQDSPIPAYDEAGAAPDHVPSLMQSFQPPGVEAEQLPDDWDITDYSGEPIPANETSPATGNVPVAPKPGVQQIPASQPGEPRQPSPFIPSGQPPRQAVPGPPVQQPPVPQPAAVPERAPTDSMEVFAAFLSGAGLDPQSVGQIDVNEAMQKYGMLFRTVVQGMMEVLMARASLKSEFRMPLTTIRPVENNPLKFSPTVDDALRNLFIIQGKGYLEPVDAIKEGFDDIKSHQMAMMAGMQAAFKGVMESFHPDKFEDTGRGGKRAALMSVNRKFRAWDAYCDFYRQVNQDADTSFQTLFGENFALAYEEQIRRLSSLK